MTIALAIGLSACVSGPRAPRSPSRPAAAPVLEMLGEVRIPSGRVVDGVTLGGLSGLEHLEGDRYLAVSDDRGSRGPHRVYRLRIDVAAGVLSEDRVEILGWTALRERSGSGMAPGVDPEGVAVAGETIYVSTESSDSDAPFVGRFGPDGVLVDRLPLGPRFDRREEEGWGPRSNLGFESLSIAPGGRWLFAGLESALYQDGPAATPGGSARVRILRFDLESSRQTAEYVYEVDPVHTASPMAEGIQVAGLVELEALDDVRLLALERSYVTGAGFAIRLYLADTTGATDVREIDRLEGVALRPVSKRLLLDFADLGVTLDNLEGMTLGPRLSDGRRTLIVIGDDNFNPLQVTQILAFVLSP